MNISALKWVTDALGSWLNRLSGQREIKNAADDEAIRAFLVALQETRFFLGGAKRAKWHLGSEIASYPICGWRPPDSCVKTTRCLRIGVKRRPVSGRTPLDGIPATDRKRTSSSGRWSAQLDDC